MVNLHVFVAVPTATSSPQRSSVNGAVAVQGSRPNGAGSASFWTTSLFACAALSRQGRMSGNCGTLHRICCSVENNKETVWILPLTNKYSQACTSQKIVDFLSVPRMDQTMRHFVGPVHWYPNLAFQVCQTAYAAGVEENRPSSLCLGSANL